MAFGYRHAHKMKADIRVMFLFFKGMTKLAIKPSEARREVWNRFFLTDLRMSSQVP
jgi:hypothetical protein